MTTTQGLLGAMTALMIAASTNAQAAQSATAAVTIVLVHGALNLTHRECRPCLDLRRDDSAAVVHLSLSPHFACEPIRRTGLPPELGCVDRAAEEFWGGRTLCNESLYSHLFSSP